MARKPATRTIAALPQARREIWEIGRRPLRLAVAELERRGERPEVLLAVQAGERGAVVSYELIASTPPPQALADFALRAMREPMRGRPRRPQAMRVATQAEAEVLVEPLAAVGVWLEVSAPLAALEDVHRELESAMGGVPGGYRTLAAQAGERLDADVLREFFRVARAFYRAELWSDFGGEVLFEIDLQAAEGPPRTLYGILMGNLGQEFGLALYASMDDLRRFHEVSEQHEDRLASPPLLADGRRPTPAELQAEAQAMANLLSVPCIGLTFTLQQDVPGPLLEEAKALKLPVANKSAFPLVMKTGQGRMQIARAGELRDTLTAMRAILAWDRQIMQMEVDDELDVTIPSILPAIGDTLPQTTACTTLRLNPCVPQLEGEGALSAELTGLLQALLDAPPPTAPQGRSKSGKTGAGKPKKSGAKSPPANSSPSTKGQRKGENPR
jgi:hypothetical protein